MEGVTLNPHSNSMKRTHFPFVTGTQKVKFLASGPTARNRRAQILTKGCLPPSPCFSHCLHSLSTYLLKILPRCRVVGFRYRAGGDLRGSLAQGSDSPQLGGESRDRGHSGLQEQSILHLGKSPSVSRRAGKALPLALEGCLLCLPVNYQTSPGLWPLYGQECMATLALLHILIFQSDTSSLSPSRLPLRPARQRHILNTDLGGTEAVKENHQPSKRLEVQGRTVAPGSEPQAVCQVQGHKPRPIIQCPLRSPHCPTATQPLGSAHSHPIPLPLLGMLASSSCKLAALPPLASLLHQPHSFILLLKGLLNTYSVLGPTMCRHPC